MVEVVDVVVQHEKRFAPGLRDPVQTAVDADRLADVVVLNEVDPRQLRREHGLDRPAQHADDEVAVR